MSEINQILLGLDQWLGSAFYFPYLLLGVGLFFTLYLGFPQIRFFKQAVNILLGRHTTHTSQGDTTHFQALTTALSGTVGTGNIGGVGLAIYLGGPAALFWMWMTAFLGMTTKYVEVTLSHKYRVTDSQGFIAGGPMYFMHRKLNAPWLAVIFAVATVISAFGTGSMPQINNIASAMESSFSFEPMWTGGILAILLAFVIIGGIKRIASVTSKIVPFMVLAYVIGAISVISFNYQNILPSLGSIIGDVFTGTAATGGFLGAGFAYAFNRGVNRGLFSNEAGQGSAPIAHASAKTDQPVKEGMVAILEPFIDTLILCTLTGLVILSSGVWTQKHTNQFDYSDMVFIQGQYSESNKKQVHELYNWLGGSEHSVKFYNGEISIEKGKMLTPDVTLINARSIAENVVFKVSNQKAFTGELTLVDGKLMDSNVIVVGDSMLHSTKLTAEAFNKGWFQGYGEYIVTIGILLFAFSTAISWSYYGDRAMTYLFGSQSVIYFRILYVAGFFVASFVDTMIIWNLAAVTVVLMTLPNLLALVLLRKDVKATQQAYIESSQPELTNKKE